MREEEQLAEGAGRCRVCLIAIATIVESGPIASLYAADVVPVHRCNGTGRVALVLFVRTERQRRPARRACSAVESSLPWMGAVDVRLEALTRQP